MDNLILSKGDLPKFIDELLKKNTVFAPVENNETIKFEQIKKGSEAKLDFCNSQYPPKAIIFNQTETLFKFKPGPKGDIEPIKLDEQKIVLEDASLSERRFEIFFLAVLFAFGLYHSVLYFGHQIVPNPDFTGFVHFKTTEPMR